MKEHLGETPEVLFIRFSSLGDILLTLPAVRSLKSDLPQARISYLTKRRYAPLLEGNPDIDRVAGLEEDDGWTVLASLTGHCRELGRFDLIVDLHRNLRSRWCRAVIPATVMKAYPKNTLMRRLWVMGWMRERMAGEERDVLDRYLEPLKALGLGAHRSVPRVFLDEGELLRAGEFLRSRGVRNPERTAVIIPGAKWPNKRWTVSGFSEVGEWLRREAGLELVLAGDKADRECVGDLGRNLHDSAVEIAGDTDLRELAGVLKLARVVIGNDSGPGHLAASVGTPVVAIFGPTCEAFGFRPIGEKVRVVSRPLACRPCSLHGGTKCRRGRRECLDDIEPASVIEAVREVTEF